MRLSETRPSRKFQGGFYGLEMFVRGMFAASLLSLQAVSGGQSMTPKALVIDDDPEIIDMVADALDSLGHRHDMANNQAEARKFIMAEK